MGKGGRIGTSVIVPTIKVKLKKQQKTPPKQKLWNAQKKNNSFTLPRILRLILLKFNYQRWNRNSSCPVDHPAPQMIHTSLAVIRTGFSCSVRERQSYLFTALQRVTLQSWGSEPALVLTKAEHRFSWKDQQIYIFQPSSGTLYGSLNYFLSSIVR